MVNSFLKSRRKGLSPRTIDWYAGYLAHSSKVIGLNITTPQIATFINDMTCTNGGKQAYFCVLNTFYRWLYSPKSGYKLNPQDNPMTWVDPPKVEKRIMPSLTSEQVDYLISQVSNIRDKAIIRLFKDSGLRLTELGNINVSDIDWGRRRIRVITKGNREGFAPFGAITEQLIRQWLTEYKTDGKLWDINFYGIDDMLSRLSAKMGLKCNPHSFRRSFACILHRQGVGVLDIKRLGRWETIAMVERYTQSITFDDSMKAYNMP